MYVTHGGAPGFLVLGNLFFQLRGRIFVVGSVCISLQLGLKITNVALSRWSKG